MTPDEFKMEWNRKQETLSASFSRSAEHHDHMAALYERDKDGRRRRKAIKARKEADLCRQTAATCLRNKVL